MAEPSAAAPRGLHEAIEAHRIYFEVERETVPRGDERITVAVRVALWATIDKRKGSLPDAPGCRAAVAALEGAARAAVARARLEPAPDVEPFRWALYSSRQVPDSDEIRLLVNVRARSEGADSPERERALERMKQALEATGVSEGTWRPWSGVDLAPAPQGAAGAPGDRAAAAAPAGKLVPAHA